MDNEEKDSKLTEVKDKAVDYGKKAAKETAKTTVKTVAKTILKAIKMILIKLGWPLIFIIIGAVIVLEIIDIVADAAQAGMDAIGDLVASISYSEEDGAIVVENEAIDTILNSIYESDIDPESIGLLGEVEGAMTEEEYQEALRRYLRKYYEAQVTTETLNLYHNESTEDKAYGSVYVYRANGENETDNRRNLTYIPYEQMQEYQANGNMDALNYFSIDANGNLVVAGTTQVTVERGSNENNLSVDNDNSSTGVTLVNINYKNVISPYSTKLTFLIDLLLTSQNPEFVSAVADLIRDSRIEITIMDNVSTNVREETYTYTPMRKWEETVAPETNSIDEEPQTVLRREAGEPVTEITRTTTVTTTPSFKPTYVKTWFCEQTINYIKKTDGPNSTESDPQHIPDEEPAGNEGEWRANQTITTVETKTIEKYEESTRGDVVDIIGEPEDAERYENNEIDTPTFVGLMATSFRLPNTTRYTEPGLNIVGLDDTLFYLLQKNQDLQNMEHLMRYALYKYTGNSYGVTELDGSLFEIQDFSTVTLGGSGLLKEYIRYWEHSSPPPTNADGTKYIIETGSAGEPVVGYGIDINTHGQEFINAGYSIEIGAEVDVEFVDAIEDRIREEYYTDIKNRTSGLNLTEYQLHALTSRAYNCGVGGAVATLRGSPSMNFVNSYNTYWNDETDNQFEEKNSNANFNHSLYTQYMSKPVTSDGEYLSGLERRRKSEWTLFQTGYYAELDQWYTDSGDILSAADQLHQAQTGWRYSTSGGLLTSGNIELAINNPNAATCCATYVSSVLYLAGCFTEEQMNSFNYNSSNALYNFLTSNGWQVINSYSELQAGDVVFMDTNGGARDITHVQLYAGDGGWYNAGSDSAIQGDAPKYYDIGSQFMVALRQN